MHSHQKTMQKIIEYIVHQQLPDGSFLSISSIDPINFSDPVHYKTTFFTSNILLSLQPIIDSPIISTSIKRDIKKIQKKGIYFLLSQKSDQWSFNYFARSNKASSTYSYPDDLDDTFAALAAIAHYDDTIIDGKTLAAIVKLLIAQELNEGGPYKTWIVSNKSPGKWKDIDVIVNSTIGYFLSLIGARAPKIESLIDQVIKDERLSSPYYPGFFQVVYFISRFYKTCGERTNDSKKLLIDILLKKIESEISKANMLEQAMIISTLANLGASEKIMHTIEVDIFKPYPFCIDPARDGKRAYAGSSALTAALCAEALINCYYPKTRGQQKSDANHAHIQDLARARSAKLGPELRSIVLQQIEKTSDEKITSLIYDLQKILADKQKIIPDPLTENLALANLYGWMAYTIYDDIVDGEGNPLLLPCANFFLRELVSIYAVIDKNVPGTNVIFKNIMDTVDSSNAWEQKNCQDVADFGNYENLGDRSIGHALGPLTILLWLGYGPDSEEHGHVRNLFHHYLIARQLHDDAHDWEEDLLRGRINSVCALLLKTSQGNESIPEWRKIFWEGTIDEVTTLILLHITIARDAKGRSEVFAGTDFMEKYLSDLKEKALKAVSERDKTLEFMKWY
jgi:hypothetical protein